MILIICSDCWCWSEFELKNLFVSLRSSKFTTYESSNLSSEALFSLNNSKLWRFLLQKYLPEKVHCFSIWYMRCLIKIAFSKIEKYKNLLIENSLPTYWRKLSELLYIISLISTRSVVSSGLISKEIHYIRTNYSILFTLFTKVPLILTWTYTSKTFFNCWFIYTLSFILT